MSTQTIQTVQNDDAYTMEPLNIEDPLIADAMVERLEDNTVITITVDAAKVDQDYNPGNMDSSTREPESFAELFGDSRHAHDQLVKMLTGINNLSSTGARDLLNQQLTLDSQMGSQLHFVLKL